MLLVLGTTAAIVVPRWSWQLAIYRADAAAQRIAVDLARTQSWAYSSSTARTISYNVGQGTYQIIGMTDPDRASAAYIVKLTDSPYIATLVSASFGGQAQVTFSGYGLPTSGVGTVVVQSGGVHRSIVVDADTGKATVQ